MLTFLVPHAEATENFWTTKASMLTERHGFGFAVVNDVLYTIGGVPLVYFAKVKKS